MKEYIKIKIYYMYYSTKIKILVELFWHILKQERQSLFQVEVCKKEKVWYVVTVLVNTICNGKKYILKKEECP